MIFDKIGTIIEPNRAYIYLKFYYFVNPYISLNLPVTYMYNICTFFHPTYVHPSQKSNPTKCTRFEEPPIAWHVEIHVTREKRVESLWERKWRAVGHHSDAWSQGCLRRSRLLQVCSYCTYRILATHARLPPMFTPKLIPTAWMPVKLTRSFVGRCTRW